MGRYDSIVNALLVMRLLTRKSLPVSKIAQETGLSTMTIYRTIRALKQAGLPVRRYEGESASYTIGHYDLMQFLSKQSNSLEKD